MIKFRYVALTAVVAAGLSAQANAIQAGGGPAPGTGNGVAAAANNRSENESYNRVIGKVGSDPVKTEKAQRAQKMRAVAATAADIKVGSTVRDKKGATIGTIESVDAEGAVIVYVSGKVRYPLIGFGKDPNGLVIDLTSDQFLALAAKAASGS